MKHNELIKIAEEELWDTLERYYGVHVYDEPEVTDKLERLKEALSND